MRQQRTPWRTLGVLLCSAAAGAFVAGCGGTAAKVGSSTARSTTPTSGAGVRDPASSGSESSAPRAGVLKPSGFVRTLSVALPLQTQFSSSTADATVVDEATQALIARCMVGNGFHYVQASEDSSALPVADEWQQYLGTIDPGNASENGYHASGETKARVRQARKQFASESYSSQPAAYWAALDGSDGRGGCSAEAQAQLGNAHGTDPSNLVGSLTTEAVDTVLESSGYRSAVSSWQSCMSRQGLPSPASPADLVSMFGKRSSVSREEIRTAVADLDCKSSSGLIAVWISELRAAESKLASANAVQIDAIEQREAALLAKARQVVDKSS